MSLDSMSLDAMSANAQSSNTRHVDGLTAQDINNIRQQCQRIAVVGLSPKPHRDSYKVAQFLLQHGYTVIPINPNVNCILDQKAYPTLGAVVGDIDMVSCFRNSDAMPALADEVIEKGAKVMWMQLGIVHHQAAEKVRAANITVVMDRCPALEYPKLIKTS